MRWNPTPPLTMSGAPRHQSSSPAESLDGNTFGSPRIDNFEGNTALTSWNYNFPAG